jgi:pimeloyl-ACP methyl ester carboxylesterase
MQEKVKIKNSKGQNIAAVIHRPETKTEKLAILCPGFLDSKDYDHLVGLANALAGRGFTVVRFDPTGTWESEGAISDYTSAQYLKDIKSVKDFMLKDENYNFILLGGHSRGGRMSLIYAAQEKNISLVLGIMPSAGSKPRESENNRVAEKTGFKTIKRDIPGFPDKFKEFVYPYDLILDSYNFNALNEVHKISASILLLAGEKDTTIPVEEVKSIYAKSNEPKKFIIIPGIGHEYRHYPDQVKIVNDIILNNL